MAIMAPTASALMSGCGAGLDTSQPAATAPVTVPAGEQVEAITVRDAPRDLVEANLTVSGTPPLKQPRSRIGPVATS
jgi:hypothetical protein